MWSTSAGRRSAGTVRGLVAALLLVLASAAPGAGAQGPAGAEVRVTLFHDTHIHGNLQAPDGTTFAHYVGLVEALRAALPAPGHSLFVGNGDDVAASPMALFAGEGLHIVESLNAAGLDAETFGVDDFAFGADRLRELVAASAFPWVSANVRDAATGQVFASDAGARPWVLKDVGGVRIGLTGAAPPDPNVVALAGGRVHIPDAAEALGEVVPEMRAAGAQVVVLLAHLCRADIERVVGAVAGIDVAVGTHCAGERLEQPRTVNGTIVSQRGHDLEWLGQLNLTIRDGRVVDHSYHAHRVTRTAPAAPAPAAVLERYRPATAAALTAPLGATAVPLDFAPPVVTTREAAAGNLVADALRAWAAADVGFHQAGGLVPRPQPVPAGPLRVGDLAEAVGGTNSAVLLRVTGAQLLAALENGVSGVERQDPRFLHVSGLRLAYDPDRPPGARVVEAAVAGHPVAPTATYTLATNSVLASGGREYAMLRQAEVLIPASEGPLLRRVLLDFVAQQGTVNPAVEGRIHVAAAAAAEGPTPAPAP